MPRSRLTNLLVFAALVAFAVVSRLIDHAPNVAAIAAAAMFAGWFFKSRLLAVATPLAAMLISDVMIGGYRPGVMVAVYGSLIAPVFFRSLIGPGRSTPRILCGAAAGSLTASILFFITTNLAVWVFGGLYAQTAAGLSACFAAAWPFFRFTVAGDLVFTAMLFGGYLLIARLSALRAPAFARLAPISPRMAVGA